MVSANLAKYDFEIKNNRINSAQVNFDLPNLNNEMEENKQLKNFPLLSVKNMPQQEGTRQNLPGKNPRILSGISQGFSESEFKQTKFVVDKVAGKFVRDKRYLNLSNLMPSNVIIQGKNISGGKLSTVKQIIEEENNLYEESKKVIISTGYQRPLTILDKYIELIEKNEASVDEFAYLIRDNPDDPYDLSVVNYSHIKDENIIDYYTISKKGLCHYFNCRPIEFINLTYWLEERATYDQIKSLKFFQKFQKWKKLKMWRKNVIRHKINNCKRELEDKLFFLNPTFRKTLLKHKEMCINMESLRFIEVSNETQQFEMSNQVPSLETFKANQEKKRKSVNEKIQEYSQDCREIVRDGFKTRYFLFSLFIK